MPTQKFLQVAPTTLFGSGIGLTDTAITVTALRYPNGDEVLAADLGDLNYATIGSGSNQEIISFTNDITKLSGGQTRLNVCVRGLQFGPPYTADNSLRNIHSGGTLFVVSNNPQLYEDLASTDNDEVITGTYRFASGEIYLGDAVPDPAGIRINDVTNQMEFRRGNTGWSTIPTQLRGVYPNFASLPPTGNAEGDIAVTSDDSKLYVWDSSLSTWVLAGGSSGAGTVYKTVKLGSESSGGDLKTFVLDSGSWPDEKFLLVYKNGLIMENDASGDYQTITTNTIEFTYTVLPTDKIVMVVISVDLYNPEWVNVNTDLLPDVDATHDIGSSSLQFKDIHFSGDIYQDGVAATSTSTADAIVQGDGSGKIDESWLDRQNDFFLPTYEAGETLAVGDIVKLTDADGDGDFVLEKLRGAETELSFPQAIATDGVWVWLTDTLVMVAESNSSNTSLDVRAYTYTESTGALTLIDTITIASMYNTAGGTVLGAKANATTAVFGTSFGGTNPGRFVVVELQSGTTLVAGASVNFLNSNRGVQAMYYVQDNVIFTVTGGFGATDYYAKTYSVGSLTVSQISSSQITEFGDNSSPKATVAAKDNSLFFLTQADNDPTPDRLRTIGFSINLSTNVITKGTVNSVNKTTIINSSLSVASVINDTYTRIFVWYTDAGTDYMRVFNANGTTLTLIQDVVIGPAPQIFFATGQKSLFSAGSSGEFIIDADTLEVKDITGNVITVSPTEFAKSTDGKTFVIYSGTSDSYQVGEFDWGEIVGLVQTPATTGEQTYIATPGEKIVNMTGLNPGQLYYLSESDPESTTFSPNDFPIYRAIDQTTAIIDQSIY